MDCDDCPRLLEVLTMFFSGTILRTVFAAGFGAANLEIEEALLVRGILAGRESMLSSR